MLPLDEMILDDQVADFEVQAHCSALAGAVGDCSLDFLEDQVNRCAISHANGGDRRERERLDFIPEEVVDFLLILPVIAPHSLLARLVE